MPLDRTGDPWSGTTYKGFSGGPAAPPEPPPAAPARRRRNSRRKLIIGGVAAALGLGLLFGFLARTEFGGWEPSVETAARPADLAPPHADQVPIAINPPPAPESPPQARASLQTLPPPPPPLPPSTPTTQGRLETLPPEMAAATQTQPPVELAPLPVAPQVAQQTTPAPGPATVVAPSDLAQPAPDPRVIASFDCAAAGTAAEQMVCSDPQLAAADRQLARAYRRALRSGVDPTDLAQEQRDWVAIREDAARRSPRAVAQAYDQRIAELNRIADDAPSGAGGPE